MIIRILRKDCISKLRGNRDFYNLWNTPNLKLVHRQFSFEARACNFNMHDFAEYQKMPAAVENSERDKTKANNKEIPIEKVKMTEKGFSKLKSVLAKPGYSNQVLRLSVAPGGCSGFQYQIQLDQNVNPDDAILTDDGAVRVVIDPDSLSLMDNCILDYKEDFIESGFKVVQNRMATANCSCGSSFDT